MKRIKNLPYRKCVGGFVVNNENKVFVGQRADTKSKAWQMPQGGVDEAESEEEAAFREVFEETGIKDVELLAVSKKWHYYDIPEEFIPQLWGGKYKGQKQRWFLFRYLGDDEDIVLDSHEQEFSEWKWVEIESLPKLAIPFKKRIYKKIAQEFGSFLLNNPNAEY